MLIMHKMIKKFEKVLEKFREVVYTVGKDIRMY